MYQQRIMGSAEQLAGGEELTFHAWNHGMQDPCNQPSLVAHATPHRPAAEVPETQHADDATHVFATNITQQNLPFQATLPPTGLLHNAPDTQEQTDIIIPVATPLAEPGITLSTVLHADEQPALQAVTVDYEKTSVAVLGTRKSEARTAQPAATPVSTTAQSVVQEPVHQNVAVPETQNQKTRTAQPMATPGSTAAQSAVQMQAHQNVAVLETQNQETRTAQPMATPGSTAAQSVVQEPVQQNVAVPETQNQETRTAQPMATPGSTAAQSAVLMQAHQNVAVPVTQNQETRTAQPMATPGSTAAPSVVQEPVHQNVAVPETQNQETRTAQPMATPGSTAAQSVVQEPVQQNVAVLVTQNQETRTAQPMATPGSSTAQSPVQVPAQQTVAVHQPEILTEQPAERVSILQDMQISLSPAPVMEEKTLVPLQSLPGTFTEQHENSEVMPYAVDVSSAIETVEYRHPATLSEAISIPQTTDTAETAPLPSLSLETSTQEYSIIRRPSSLAEQSAAIQPSVSRHLAQTAIMTPQLQDGTHALEHPSSVSGSQPAIALADKPASFKEIPVTGVSQQQTSGTQRITLPAQHHGSIQQETEAQQTATRPAPQGSTIAHLQQKPPLQKQEINDAMASETPQDDSPGNSSATLAETSLSTDKPVSLASLNVPVSTEQLQKAALSPSQILSSTLDELTNALLVNMDESGHIHEIRLLLKPDVLDGTTIILKTSPEHIEVSFLAATETIAQLLCEHQNRILESLATSGNLPVTSTVMTAEGRRYVRKSID